MENLKNLRGDILFSDPLKSVSKRIFLFILLIILLIIPGCLLLLIGNFHTDIFPSGRENVIKGSLMIIIIGLIIGTFVGWGGILKKPLRIRERGIEWPLPWPILKRREYIYLPYEKIISIYLDIKENGEINKEFDDSFKSFWPTGMVITISEEYAKTIRPSNPGGYTKYRLTGKAAEIIIPYLQRAIGLERWNNLVTTDKSRM